MHTLLIGLALLAAVAVGVAWYTLCARRPVTGTLIVVAIACFSSHLLALLYAATVPASFVRTLIPVKDVLAGLLLLALLVRAPRRQSKRLLPCLVLAFGLVPAMALGLSRYPLQDVALGARGLAVPITGLAIGLLLRPEERVQTARASVLIIAAGAAYALAEYFAPRSWLVSGVGVGRYWAEVKQQPAFLVGDLPGNFYTATGVRRLSGAFGDPLTAGYVLSAGLFLSLLHYRGRRLLALGLLFLVGLALSFTRAGWIIAAASLMGAAATSPLVRRQLRVIVPVAAVGAALIALLPPFNSYLRGIFSGEDGSTLAHIQALENNLGGHYSAIGTGVGGAGAAVAAQHPGHTTVVGTESVLATVALQTGLTGLGLYVALLGSLISQVVRASWPPRRRVLFWTLLVAVSLTSLISEQLLTFNGGWPLCLAVALGAGHPGIDHGKPQRASAALVVSRRALSRGSSEPAVDRLNVRRQTSSPGHE